MTGDVGCLRRVRVAADGSRANGTATEGVDAVGVRVALPRRGVVAVAGASAPVGGAACRAGVRQRGSGVEVEKADRRASADLIKACDTALDTGGALGRLLKFIAHRHTPESEPASAPTVEFMIKLTAEVVAANPARQCIDAAIEEPGGARIYPFPAGGAHAGDGA